jgi:hypothetical protein
MNLFFDTLIAICLLAHRVLYLAGVVLVWLVICAGATEGASDLLDPGKIGSRPTPSATSPGSAVVSSGRGSGLQPSYARDMASTVVLKIDFLTARGVSLLDEHARLLAKLRDLDAKRHALIQDKEAEMEDYRKGLFCSGCNRTKRDIESKGDTFPHPGQQIVKATQAQIDAKDRALQKPINLMTDEMAQLEKRINELKAAIDEVIDQIDVGIQLWSAAETFEELLIHRLELEHLAASRASRSRIDLRISNLKLELLQAENALPPDSQRIAAAIEDRKPWDEAMARLEEERRNRRRKHGDMLMRADLTARDEASRINGFTARGSIRLHLSPMATASVTYLSIGRPSRAEFFRMGDATPSRKGQTLASVDEFIRNFKEGPTERSPTLAQPDKLPTAAPEPVDRTLKSLKDLLEPGSGEKAKPKSGNPGGIRG